MLLLEERHAPEVFAVVDRERAYLREWLPWVDGTAAVGDSLAFIQTALKQFADNDGLTAGIWCEEEFAGTVGTHKIDWLNRKVELGYWIASRFQGRGIITNASRALVNHCFDEWKLHRVEIHCATGNLKSCAIPDRLGFRLEGVLREAHFVSGHFHDLNVYGLLATERDALRDATPPAHHITAEHKPLTVTSGRALSASAPSPITKHKLRSTLL